jgi:hypothetical protein
LPFFLPYLNLQGMSPAPRGFVYGTLALLSLIPSIDGFLFQVNGRVYREAPSHLLGPTTIRYENPRLDEYGLPLEPTSPDQKPVGFKVSTSTGYIV